MKVYIAIFLLSSAIFALVDETQNAQIAPESQKTDITITTDSGKSFTINTDKIDTADSAHKTRARRAYSTFGTPSRRQQDANADDTTDVAELFEDLEGVDRDDNEIDKLVEMCDGADGLGNLCNELDDIDTIIDLVGEEKLVDDQLILSKDDASKVKNALLHYKEMLARMVENEVAPVDSAGNELLDRRNVVKSRMAVRNERKGQYVQKINRRRRHHHHVL